MQPSAAWTRFKVAPMAPRAVVVVALSLLSFLIITLKCSLTNGEEHRGGRREEGDLPTTVYLSPQLADPSASAYQSTHIQHGESLSPAPHLFVEHGRNVSVLHEVYVTRSTGRAAAVHVSTLHDPEHSLADGFRLHITADVKVRSCFSIWK